MGLSFNWAYHSTPLIRLPQRGQYRADEKSDTYAVDDFLDSLRTPASLPSTTKRPTIEFVTPKQKEKR
mgnify:CR=1 FL=1